MSQDELTEESTKPIESLETQPTLWEQALDKEIVPPMPPPLLRALRNSARTDEPRREPARPRDDEQLF